MLLSIIQGVFFGCCLQTAFHGGRRGEYGGLQGAHSAAEAKKGGEGSFRGAVGGVWVWDGWPGVGALAPAVLA